MATYWQVIFFSLVGGLFSLIGGVLLLSNKKAAQKLARYATPFAAGALLAAVFVDLLKEGIEASSTDRVLIATMIGIVLFFMAERFLRWFHHHHSHDDQHDATVPLIIIGDTLHNALDGVAIAASFLIDVRTGIITTIAVAAHEIPQEIGDFGLLLAKGMSRMKVLVANAVSALATTFAAVLVFALGSKDNFPTGILLGISAGFLLYIALSDIIPSIHEDSNDNHWLGWQTAMLITGVIVVSVCIKIAEKFITG